MYWSDVVHLKDLQRLKEKKEKIPIKSKWQVNTFFKKSLFLCLSTHLILVNNREWALQHKKRNNWKTKIIGMQLLILKALYISVNWRKASLKVAIDCQALAQTASTWVCGLVGLGGVAHEVFLVKHWSKHYLSPLLFSDSTQRYLYIPLSKEQGGQYNHVQTS